MSRVYCDDCAYGRTVIGEYDTEEGGPFCALGHNIRFRVPLTMQDIALTDWGWIRKGQRRCGHYFELMLTEARPEADTLRLVEVKP